MKPQTESSEWVDTTTYLAQTVAVMREHEYVPAASTEEQPTWRVALERLGQAEELAPDDQRRAQEILGWVASLKPRDPHGYRARMAACLAHERLTERELPLAASAVRAFNLHLYYEIRGRKSRKPPQPVTRDSPRT